MWFLSCEGDHLGGKRLWLRPGSTHLIGRMRSQSDSNRFYAITHKSVSRQHAKLQVDLVQPGDSAHVYKKSKLTLTDLGSKAGTNIDGDQIKDVSRVLDKGSHVIRLGKYDVRFLITWEPTVFTFAALSRAARQSADPLAAQKAKLEPLGIKCVSEFLTNDTTHVFAKKRNTVPCLQALVQGRAVVVDSFVEAVETAARRPDSTAGAGTGISKLEEDYDANWPPELGFFPPAGNEPKPRPDNDSSFLRSAQRPEMFSKYIFIFTDANQYENFLPVIAGGSGKAVLHEIQTSASGPDLDEFLDFAKSCAGRKGDSAFRMSQFPASQGGVIVVRPAEKSIVVEEFYTRLDLALDQRSVEQNEFLEAILSVNASSLRQALQFDHEGADASADHQADQPAQPEDSGSGPARENGSTSASIPDSSGTKRKPRRTFTRQKLTTFDDFDPSQIVKYSPPPSQNEEFESQTHEAGSNGDAQPSQASNLGSTQRSRKRRAESPIEAVQTTEQVLDNLFTGAAAMKKRRLEEAARGKSTFASGTNDPSPDRGDKRSHRKSEKEQEEDLQRIMQERREEQDRLRQQDEEKLLDAMGEMNVAELRDLAQVEEMEIKPRRPTAVLENIDSGTDVSSRWKPEWNGRANWKKFKKRRPGQQSSDSTNVPTLRKVIVQLEPYDPRGSKEDDFWLQSTSPRASQVSISGRNNHSSSSTTHTATADSELSQTGSVALRRRIEKSRQDDGRDHELSELLPEEIGGRPRDPALRVQLDEIRRSDSGRRNGGSTSGLSSLGQSIFERSRAKGKPTAGASAASDSSNVGTRKRGREVDEAEDDEDDGGLKFRRRRRG